MYRHHTVAGYGHIAVLITAHSSDIDLEFARASSAAN